MKNESQEKAIRREKLKVIKLFLPFLIVVLLTALSANANSVVLTRTEKGSSAQELRIQQDKKTVTGTILDEDDRGLPGVNISIQGSSTGTITNIKGNFSIEVPSADAVLLISFVGYISEEIKVGEQTQLKIYLVPDIEILSEVVVIGYGTVRKTDLTGSVTSVNAEKLEDLPVLGIDQALQGNAAGVTVTQDNGAPGAPVSVRIRGMGTITNNDPLYVIDGTPVSAGDINYLNPSDIESINVLKDASASAIYGSRGANGVILITTKKGKAGETNLNFEAYYGMQNPVGSPSVMSAQQYVDFLNEYELAGYEEYDPNLDWGRGTDWWDHVTDPAPIQDYNLSMSGGSETSTFLFSMNYFTQDGIIRNTHYDRFSLRVNSEHKFLNRITIGENVALVKSYENGEISNGDFGNTVASCYMADPMTEPYDSTGNWLSPSTYPGTPLVDVDLNIPNVDKNKYRLIGNVFMELEILKDLKFRSDLGTNLKFEEREFFRQAYTVIGETSPTTHSMERSLSQAMGWNWTNTLNYSKTLGKKNRIAIMLGQEAQHSSYYPMSLVADSIPAINDNFKYLTSGRNVGYSPQYYTENRLLSYFGRVNYAYADKILVTATLRRDGSSRFGSENKWGLFPSFAFAYRLGQEQFMKNIQSISDIKLRAGWGSVGNQAIRGDYPWSTSWTQQQMYTNGSAFYYGVALNALGDPTIHWEEQTSTNVGIDLEMFENKLSFSADYFVKNTSGVLYLVDLPYAMGYPDPAYQNIADIQNRGVEFAVSYRDYDGELGYEVGLNFTRYSNEVTNLGDGDREQTNMFRSAAASIIDEGYPISVFYGYKSDGLFEDWEDVAENGYKNARPGDIKFIDINGDKILDSRDRTIIGSPHPVFSFGINTNLSYKGFDLSLNGYSSIGQDVHYNVSYWTNANSLSSNQDLSVLNAWTPENTDTDVHRVGNTKQNLLLSSDFYLHDASFFKLKRVQLSYTIPQKALDKIKMKGLSIYVASQNLFTLTNYPGMEPEVGVANNYSNRTSNYEAEQVAFGLDYGIYPQPRTFLGGIKIRL